MSEEKKLHEEGCGCGCEDCDEEVNVVELVDDQGKVHKCYHIGTIEYKDGWYAFFQTAEEDREGEEDEVTILQIVGEEGSEELVPVEDDKLLDEVFEEFCRIMEEDDDADEAASLDTDYEEGCGCGCKHHRFVTQRLSCKARKRYGLLEGEYEIELTSATLVGELFKG